MVLIVKRLIVMVALVFVVGMTLPVAAHREHNETNAAASAPRVNTPGAMHEMMEDHQEAMEAQRPATFGGRLVRFLGQIHPFAVHFPIALFPVSWVALIIARRRRSETTLIRAFVVVAGLTSVIAAALGWLSAGSALTDTDPILTAHRWTGTVLAALGVYMALQAWRSAEAVKGRVMLWLLGSATLMLIAQGFMGAVLVHGWEHIAF